MSAAQTPPFADGFARRSFLKASALGAAAAAVGSGNRASGAPLHDPVPRLEAPPFAFEETGLDEIARRLGSGETTTVALVDAYLERIAALDRRGPELRAVIETNPEAPAIAAALDAERRERGPRGPLHGIPVLLKDNVDTADRMATTAGSLALVGARPRRDAFLARRLREAGAVLLGKANLSEWANFRSTRSTSGWSARGGQARNPYSLDRNPCGSSSGSATAVAACLTAVSVGTETDGSIVCPASANGVVGLKPTLGLVSRTGVVPIAHSQDTAGPMGRSVRDVAIVLGALAGVDRADAATAAAAGHLASDYTRFLDPAGLKGARLGVARSFFGKDDRVDRLMEEALAEMRRQGAELMDVDLGTGQDYQDSEFEVLLYEFKADLEAYLAGLGPAAHARTLADLIRFNEERRDAEMPYFGQDIFVMAQEKGPLTEAKYTEALARNQRLSRDEGLDKALGGERLDAIVAPTGGPAWLTDLVNGDHFTGVSSSSPPAVSGYPTITVPAGFVFGLPVGLTLMGAAWSEPVLLRLAYAFEQATRHRRAPRFLRTVELGGLG